MNLTKIIGAHFGTPYKEYKKGVVNMWKLKTFKNQEALQNFINKNKSKIQYNIIFINNGYGLEYKKLIKIY